MAENTSTAGSGEGTFRSKAEAFKDHASLWRYWMDAWDVAGEQEADWRKRADNAVKIYRGDETLASTNSFNILYSNVSVKVPAVYNSTPEPDVRPRDRSQKDPQRAEAERLTAQAIDLALRYELDEYDFDAVARAIVRDSQIAGRGIGRVRWRTYTSKDAETGEDIVWEETYVNRWNWRFFRHGPGTSMADVPWVGYEHALTYDQIVKLAGEDIAKEINYDETSRPGSNDNNKNARELSVWQRAKVIEIWDKDTRKVMFFCPGYDKGPLLIEDDPYGLLDFFDCEVLHSDTDPDSLTPIVPYEVYRKQAEELSVLSARILALAGLLKFRGIRASEIPEFSLISDLDDGEFLVSQGALSLVQGAKGLDDAIWVWPIDKIASTLKEMLLQREAIKQVIYEITGISDILRGASNPNETLGAQQIKAQAGSLRANDEQKATEKLCRNLLRKKAEIVANKFSETTLGMILGEELQPQVVQILRSDILRRYSVDVETNSTIRGDLARNQEQMAGFMASAGQFIQTFVPLIQSGQFPPQLAMAAVTVFGAFAKQYKLGKVVDDTLANLEEAAKAWMQQQSEPNPEEEQKKAEAEEIKRRLAHAAADEAEGAAQKVQAEAVLTGVKAQSLIHDARRATATELMDVREGRSRLVKGALEVEGQQIENAQQQENLRGAQIDNEHKAQRGAFAPDPTELAKAKIGQQTAIHTGQQKADASVQTAREKAAAPKDDGPDFKGFVQ